MPHRAWTTTRGACDQLSQIRLCFLGSKEYQIESTRQKGNIRQKRAVVVSDLRPHAGPIVDQVLERKRRSRSSRRRLWRLQVLLALTMPAAVVLLVLGLAGAGLRAAGAGAAADGQGYGGGDDHTKTDVETVVRGEHICITFMFEFQGKDPGFLQVEAEGGGPTLPLLQETVVKH